MDAESLKAAARDILEEKASSDKATYAGKDGWQRLQDACAAIRKRTDAPRHPDRALTPLAS